MHVLGIKILKLKAGSSERSLAKEKLAWLRKVYWEMWEVEYVRMLLHPSVKVIGSTLSAAHSRHIISATAERNFDLVIIDEAAQATEPACWQALLKGRKAVLAGDDCQLGPTVLSEKAKEGTWRLDRSLFERLREECIGPVHMLTTQFRMDWKIMEWVSNLMYNGQLVAHPSVRDHELKDLKAVSMTGPPADVLDRMVPLVFLDTHLCPERGEIVNPRSESKGNREKVKIAWAHCGMLLEAGVPGPKIVLISPYKYQVELLELGRPGGRKVRDVKVSTIDNIQGAEFEAVVISMVRSNPGRRVGFCGDRRRMNVAVSRARRHVAVIGDSLTLGNDSLLESLLDHCKRYGITFGADLPIPQTPAR